MLDNVVDRADRISSFCCCLCSFFLSLFFLRKRSDLCQFVNSLINQLWCGLVIVRNYCKKCCICFYILTIFSSVRFIINWSNDLWSLSIILVNLFFFNFLNLIKNSRLFLNKKYKKFSELSIYIDRNLDLNRDILRFIINYSSQKNIINQTA